MTTEQLKSIFENDYNREDWRNALQEIFHIKTLYAIPSPVDLGANDFDAKAVELGNFETVEGLQVGLYEVSISPEKRLDRNKVGLRNLMRKVYQNDGDAALIVFTQGHTWRFTYASELTIVNKETGQRERKQTDPKRYTYIFGRNQHCRTAAERFKAIKLSSDLLDNRNSLSEIEKAYSVDTLTKDFYRELSNWYFWALTKIEFPNDAASDKDIRNSTNTIRLITRLIFVWFLKQKKLVPDALFDKDKVFAKLNFIDRNNSTYYKAILQNLFFATLNQEMEKRSFRKEGQHYNITNLFRYKRYFKDYESALVELFSEIPFLNGGLFECLDKPHPTEKTAQGYEKIVRIDGFSDRDDNKICIPDYLFFGGAESVDLSEAYDDTRQKNLKVRGLIDILNSYNFTVEENTPLDIQVALDPELLGKVFENLLASYNPETKTTARKQTGSFYTPREIVHYMVDESLKAYLTNKLIEKLEFTWRVKYSDPSDNRIGTTPEIEDFIVSQKELLQQKITDLLSYSDANPAFEPQEVLYLIEAVDGIKVLDPACGSGAFPMGVLHQLVHILQKVDYHNHHWKTLQLRKAQLELQNAMGTNDAESFKASVDETMEAFNNNSHDYGRKLFLIENCIYGVDIQPIAVQISKLRFFISLICEQDPNPEIINLGIKPLPNLETKFVAANSLIGLDTASTFKPDSVYALEKQLEDVRHHHFSARTSETKRKYRDRDKTLREQIAKELINTGFPSTSADQIANWNPYNQNTNAPFFDKYWMFGIEDGFDIVIGNPPYIGHKGGLKELFRELKETSLGKMFNNERMDIFYYFFHISLYFINEKGIIAFITTNYYLTADSAIKLRKDFKERARVFKLVNFNELKVFESAMGQHNILTFLSKNKALSTCQIVNINRNGFAGIELLNQILSFKDRQTNYYQQEISSLYDGDKCYIRLQYADVPMQSITNVVIEKIKSNNQLLGCYCNISQGIVTGLDKVSPKHIKRNREFEYYNGEGVFVVSDAEKVVIGDSPLFKPWFKNSDIKRYFVKDICDKWLIHTSVNVNLLEYTNIYHHLNKFKKLIVERNYESGELSKAARLQKWWALSSSRWEFDFDKPKIVSPQRSYNNEFAYTEASWYASADVYFITEKDKSVSLKYILAVLNSKLIYFWLYNRGKRKGEMLELYLTPLTEVPIPKIDFKTQELFIHVVDKILNSKQLNSQSDISRWEHRLDEMVYKLYELTFDEVKIIDPDFWLSKEEYDLVRIR